MRRLKVLIACEFSGIVRDEFIGRGHDAVSCDLLPSESDRGPHIIGDVHEIADDRKWDLIVAFPPCTHLCVSGARWFKGKAEQQKDAIEFFMFFTRLSTRYMAVENPIGIMSKLYRKPDQIIHPWWFGHREKKSTCLWLKGLPLLIPSKVCIPTRETVHRMAPGPDRWKNRSRTFKGIARAMAQQWSRAIQEQRKRCKYCDDRFCYHCPDCGGFRDLIGTIYNTCKCEPFCNLTT